MNALAKIKLLTKHSTTRQLINILRYCSDTPTNLTHRYDVSTFGELRVKTGSTCDLSVESIDAQLYPHQNVAFLDDGKGNRCSSSLKVESFKNGLSIGNGNALHCLKEMDSSPICRVQVPVRFNLHLAVTGKRNISVQNMHSDSVRASLEHGNCLLNKLQCGSVTVESKGGDIISEGSLQGNTVLETQGSGTVRLYKPLCQRLNVTTCGGDIHVTSLYADTSTFNTQSGCVHIGSAHRDVNINIAERGNIAIDSLDGSLNAKVKSGNISLYISRHNGVNIFVETGNIKLKLSDSLRAKVQLIGTKISFDDKLDTSALTTTKDNALTIMKGTLQSQADDESSSEALLDNESEIRVQTLDGLIDLEQQDWFSTVKLSNSVATETQR